VLYDCDDDTSMMMMSMAITLHLSHMCMYVVLAMNEVFACDRYYQDIKTMPAISDQDMNAMLAEESRVCHFCCWQILARCSGTVVTA